MNDERNHGDENSRPTPKIHIVNGGKRTRKPDANEAIETFVPPARRLVNIEQEEQWCQLLVVLSCCQLSFLCSSQRLGDVLLTTTKQTIAHERESERPTNRGEQEGSRVDLEEDVRRRATRQRVVRGEELQAAILELVAFVHPKENDAHRREEDVTSKKEDEPIPLLVEPSAMWL